MRSKPKTSRTARSRRAPATCRRSVPRAAPPIVRTGGAACETGDQMGATLAGLAGIAPQDDVEGMMAAQLIATHATVMECHRRAGRAVELRGARRRSEPCEPAVRTFGCSSLSCVAIAAPGSGEFRGVTPCSRNRRNTPCSAVPRRRHHPRKWVIPYSAAWRRGAPYLVQASGLLDRPLEPAPDLIGADNDSREAVVVVVPENPRNNPHAVRIRRNNPMQSQSQSRKPCGAHPARHAAPDAGDAERALPHAPRRDRARPRGPGALQCRGGRPYAICRETARRPPIRAGASPLVARIAGCGAGCISPPPQPARPV
jgi:hypothetical protein